MARRGVITLSVLSHLKKCPKCKFYVGAPIMCKGKSDELNEGFYYEKCLNNRQPVPDSCKHFAWRRDIGRGKHGRGKELCCGELCKAAGKQHVVNLDCSFGVCARCCRHIQPHLPTPISCVVKDHRDGVQLAKEAGKGMFRNGSGSALASVEEGVPRGDQSKAKRGKKKNASSKVAVLDLTEDQSDGEGDIVEATPDRAPPKRGSYATPVSAGYFTRVSDLDTEHRVRTEVLATRARQAYAKSHVKTVSMRWWTTDGGAPDLVEVDVENPSAFHPKDVPFLVNEYACDRVKFQYYDNLKGVWYTGAATSATRDLNKVGDDGLYYRCMGVTSGVGMPGVDVPASGTQTKRAAPTENLYPETPRRPQPPFGAYSFTPESRARLAYSPATTPPRSGSSAWPDDSGPEDLGMPTCHPWSPSYPADDVTAVNAATPLPALFPTIEGEGGGPSLTVSGFGADADTTFPPIPSGPLTASSAITPSPFVQQALIPGAGDVIVDISTAPRRSDVDWPFKYVCDMAVCFDLIRKWEDTHPGRKKAGVSFKAVLGIDYKPSTWNDQYRAWTAAGGVPGEQQAWIALGRTSQGEWVSFMRRWRPVPKRK